MKPNFSAMALAMCFLILTNSIELVASHEGSSSGHVNSDTTEKKYTVLGLNYSQFLAYQKKSYDFSDDFLKKFTFFKKSSPFKADSDIDFDISNFNSLFIDDFKNLYDLIENKKNDFTNSQYLRMWNAADALGLDEICFSKLKGMCVNNFFRLSSFDPSFFDDLLKKDSGPEIVNELKKNIIYRFIDTLFDESKKKFEEGIISKIELKDVLADEFYEEISLKDAIPQLLNLFIVEKEKWVGALVFFRIENLENNKMIHYLLLYDLTTVKAKPISIYSTQNDDNKLNLYFNPVSFDFLIFEEKESSFRSEKSHQAEKFGAINGLRKGKIVFPEKGKAESPTLGVIHQLYYRRWVDVLENFWYEDTFENIAFDQKFKFFAARQLGFPNYNKYFFVVKNQMFQPDKESLNKFKKKVGCAYNMPDFYCKDLIFFVKNSFSFSNYFGEKYSPSLSRNYFCIYDKDYSYVLNFYKVNKSYLENLSLKNLFGEYLHLRKKGYSQKISPEMLLRQQNQITPQRPSRSEFLRAFWRFRR